MANIRPADDIVGENVSDNGVTIGMGELRRWRQERLAVFPVATTIEDMFSASDKSRPDSPARNAYRTIRGGRTVRGVLRSRSIADGKVAENSTIPARCGLPKADRILPDSARSAVGGRARGTRGWPVPAAETQDSSGPHGQADRCLTSRAMPRGRYQWRPSSLFPRLGESFLR